MSVYEDKIIRQDSGKNILWQIFRNLIEEVQVPKEMDAHNQDYIRQVVNKE